VALPLSALVVEVAWRYDWASPGSWKLTGTTTGRRRMTQQYLAGELSVLLARLQAVATNQAVVRDVAQLRRGAETGPVTALPTMVVRALALTDRLCWDSLERGDSAAFTCQAAICAELREFGVCARLLQER
jgi:hypothetical protein